MLKLADDAGSSGVAERRKRSKKLTTILRIFQGRNFLGGTFKELCDN